MTEPYNLDLPTIARLTDFQICCVLFRPDEQQRRRDPANSMSMLEAVNKARAFKGLPPVDEKGDVIQPKGKTPAKPRP